MNIVLIISPAVCRQVRELRPELRDMVPECDDHTSAKVVVDAERKPALRAALLRVGSKNRSQALDATERGDEVTASGHRRVARDAENLVMTLDTGRGVWL